MGPIFRFVGVGLCLVLGTSELVRSEPQGLVLDGVIVAENPSHSIALVRRSEGGRAVPLRIGQQYYGYVLVAVGDRSALFDSVRGELRLHVGAEGDGATALTSEPPRESPKQEKDGWVYRDVSRVEARARLEKELPVILSETELSPHVDNGEILGLEIRRLPDGTLLSESGLLPGDILRSINGEPLRGLDSLWDLLARLRDADELRVVVERRGEVLRLAYALTD